MVGIGRRWVGIPPHAVGDLKGSPASASVSPLDFLPPGAASRFGGVALPVQTLPPFGAGAPMDEMGAEFRQMGAPPWAAGAEFREMGVAPCGAGAEFHAVGVPPFRAGAEFREMGAAPLGSIGPPERARATPFHLSIPLPEPNGGAIWTPPPAC